MELSKPATIALIIGLAVVVIVGGYFLYRSVTTKEQGVMKPEGNNPISQMQQFGQEMTKGGARGTAAPGMAPGAPPMTPGVPGAPPMGTGMPGMPPGGTPGVPPTGGQ